MPAYRPVDRHKLGNSSALPDAVTSVLSDSESKVVLPSGIYWPPPAPERLHQMVGCRQEHCKLNPCVGQPSAYAMV